MFYYTFSHYFTFVSDEMITFKNILSREQNLHMAIFALSILENSVNITQNTDCHPPSCKCQYLNMIDKQNISLLPSFWTKPTLLGSLHLSFHYFYPRSQRCDLGTYINPSLNLVRVCMSVFICNVVFHFKTERVLMIFHKLPLFHPYFLVVFVGSSLYKMSFIAQNC